MIAIRPVSDLRNNFTEISEICHSQDEPIFFTKNGSGDLAVMSIEAYEKTQARLTLLTKLAEAEAESRSGKIAGSHEEVMTRVEKLVR
jgi:prevent-host-death family protein